jgi:branched-chain amino acid transport system ATP-binding protein
LFDLWQRARNSFRKTSMPEATHLLAATDVSKSFGEFRAVAGADLTVNGGDIIGLIGPNGAGKSTFFNCLAGETMPSGERIVFDGKDLTRASPEAHARAGIGRTFQVPTAFAEMSIIHNVMVGAFLRHPHRNDARDKARALLELTGLHADQPARSLGTPGRKRLEIARALAAEPRLLLLDESLAGLTPTELQEAIALVRRIHESGVTIVIVEHIMEVIMTLTSHVLAFNQGHVIAKGTPDSVVRDPAVIEAYLGRSHRRPADDDRRLWAGAGRFRRNKQSKRWPNSSSSILKCAMAISSASPMSRCVSCAARSSLCSARMAPAKPRRSTPLPAWCAPRAGASCGGTRKFPVKLPMPSSAKGWRCRRKVGDCSSGRPSSRT